jgi:cytochrome P450
MEPGRHEAYRRKLQSCMKAGVLAGCEGFIERRTALELGEMAARCSRSPTGGVRPYSAIDRLVFLVLSRVFFGIQPEEPVVPRLRHLYRVVDHRKLWRRSSRTREAMTEIVTLVLSQAGRLRAEDSANPTSFLDQASRNDPDLVEDPMFLENFVYLLHIARCDLSGLCGWLLKMLGDHPNWGLKVRSSREVTQSADPTGPAGRFVDETLRLRQSEYLYRTTSGDIQFEGFSIPAGWLVRLCIRESHTSGEVFRCPHEFDADRFLHTSYSQDQYQPFGIYEHACLGIGITKTIGRIFVEQLASGFDWEIARDGPMELGLHHHRHWAPSSRLEFRLTPRGA